MRQRIYLCEGETERHLVMALKARGLIEPGKVQVFNSAQKDVKRMLRKWGWEKREIILIVDADTGPYLRNSKLAKNLMNLEKTHVPRLILQCENLEDELERCCSTNLHGLYQAFNASSASEFKKKFLKLREGQLIDTLKNHGFSTERLWEMRCRQGKLDNALARYLCSIKKILRQ